MLPEKTVEALGQSIRYLTLGSGPNSVLLLHGNPSTPWVYQPLMEALPEDLFSSVAIDWYGESDRPWGGYNISAYADQAREVMDALNIQRATIVGHSLGGVTGLIFALRYPERLTGLVLVGTGATVAGHGYLDGMIDRLKTSRSKRETLEAMMPGAYGTPPAADLMRRYIDHVMPTPIEAYIEAASSTYPIDLTPLLRFIHCPALVVHGLQDTGRQLFHAEAMAKGIPRSRLLTIDTGHYVMQEAETEFNAAVLAFLQEEVVAPTAGARVTEPAR